MSTAAKYLKTLRRIPDDIVLSMAAREIKPKVAASCICGWAIREAIAREAGVDASRASAPLFVSDGCVARFGGEYWEWANIFWGVAQPEAAPIIEEAFVTRVMEAAGVSA